jgi:DDE superfamily endonuclease
MVASLLALGLTSQSPQEPESGPPSLTQIVRNFLYVIVRDPHTAGAKLPSLPKSSPDLNPIEQVFAKLKNRLRKARARSIETIFAAIGEYSLVAAARKNAPITSETGDMEPSKLDPH